MKIKEIQTVLITGASGGLGLEIARECASKGMTLILTARSAGKLSEAQEELSAKYGVKVYCVVADLSAEGASDELYEYCSKNQLCVDMLINNAGAGLFGESVELAKERTTSLLYLNIIALTRLCALFGKDMKTRGKGIILNIGSVAGNQPTPLFASYAASKSYVLNYSIALRQELGQYGVSVTCVQPGYIRTAFDEGCSIPDTKYRSFSHKNGMDADAVARIAVHSALAGRSFVRAGFTNKCAAFFSALVPKNLLAGILLKSVKSMTAR